MSREKEGGFLVIPTNETLLADKSPLSSGGETSASFFSRPVVRVAYRCTENRDARQIFNRLFLTFSLPFSYPLILLLEQSAFDRRRPFDIRSRRAFLREPARERAFMKY